MYNPYMYHVCVYAHMYIQACIYVVCVRTQKKATKQRTQAHTYIQRYTHTCTHTITAITHKRPLPDDVFSPLYVEKLQFFRQPVLKSEMHASMG